MNVEGCLPTQGALVAPPLPVPPPKTDMRVRLLSWGQDHLLCPRGWSWRGVSISSRAVGRVAVKVTGDVSCSPDCHSVPALACHCPGLTSLDLNLLHWSLIAPVGQLPPLAPFESLSPCLRPLGPTVPCHEAHGLPWGRGTTVFSPRIVPWPLEPLSALGWGLLGLMFVWFTSGHFPAQKPARLRPFLLHHAVRGGSDQTSETPRSSQTSGQQMNHQRRDLKGHGKGGWCMCCRIIITPVVFCSPTVGV